MTDAIPDITAIVCRVDKRTIGDKTITAVILEQEKDMIIIPVPDVKTGKRLAHGFAALLAHFLNAKAEELDHVTEH